MRTQTNQGDGRRSGYTLIELMISVALLGIVLGSLAMMGVASDRACRTSSLRTNLDQQATVALDRVLAELRLAAAESVQPPLGAGEVSGSIQYAQPAGLDAAKLVLSPARRLSLELEAGELDDGLDNNGNGLVDERRLVLTEDVGGPGEKKHVVTHWVRELLEGEEDDGADDNANGLIDEPGFAVTREGATLFVQMTLERLDAEGRTIRRTVRSSTSMRN